MQPDSWVDEWGTTGELDPQDGALMLTSPLAIELNMGTGCHPFQSDEWRLSHTDFGALGRISLPPDDPLVECPSPNTARKATLLHRQNSPSSVLGRLDMEHLETVPIATNGSRRFPLFHEVTAYCHSHGEPDEYPSPPATTEDQIEDALDHLPTSFEADGCLPVFPTLSEFCLKHDPIAPAFSFPQWMDATVSSSATVQ